MKLILKLTTIILVVGFFTSCQNAPKGEKAVTKAAETVTKKAASQTFKVSNFPGINWTGSKIGGSHNGTLTVTDGTINANNGKVVGGKITIDMNSLICKDLEAGKGKEKLEGHLKSADFFDVANNPTSTFEITKVTDGANGQSNVTGNLTMMGVTKSITFPAQIEFGEGAISVTSADFTINRTDFGMKYGSASFFDDLKDKAINDEVGLKIGLKARL